MATQRRSGRKSSSRSLQYRRRSLEPLEPRRLLAVIHVPTDMGLAAAITAADTNADTANTIDVAPAPIR